MSPSSIGMDKYATNYVPKQSVNPRQIWLKHGLFFFHRAGIVLSKMEEEMKVEVENKWIFQDEGAKRKLNEIIGNIGQLSSKFFEEDLF